MRKALLVCSLVLACSVVGAAAQAAELVCSPAVVTLAAAPGQRVSETLSCTIQNPPPSPAFVQFILSQSGGTAPPSWLAVQFSTITPTVKTVQVPVAFQVSADTAAGKYTANLRPFVLSSNIPLLPAAPTAVAVTLAVARQCSAEPVLTVSAFGPEEFRVPNNKVEEARFAGVVTLPDGCTLKRAWFTLTDEYREYDQGGPLAVGTDGAVSLTVPVMVSRRGADRDGRLYRLSVFAEDEAGTAVVTRGITVAHDQRGGK